ncbi:MAG: YoaK family protein [Endozoicomonas sp.]
MIRKLPVWVWFGGVLLTLSAGLINSVALLSYANQAVTHVTGSISLSSVAMSQGNWSGVGHLSAVVVFFFLGSVLSGAITRGSQLRKGRRYGVAMLLESFLLLCSMMLFTHSSLWGQLIASLACGLQNGMVTTFSGAIIRTTHMTGIVTDLGNKIGLWLTGGEMDLRRFCLYQLLLSGFISGGIIGALSFETMGYYTLLIPAVITGAGGLAYMIHVIKLRKKRESIEVTG